MATLVLNGHPTWGVLPGRRGVPVVALHGGHSSSAKLRRHVGRRLERRLSVGYFDRRGHGKTAPGSGPLSYEDMREETVAYLTQLGRRADLFGYSDGGIVALLTALARPDLVRRLVVVGANFHFSGLHPFETPGVPSEAFTSFSQEFARHNPAGSAAAADVFRGGFALCATSPALTAEQLSAVVAPTLVVTGDDDVVRLDHSVALYESLPAAQLFVVPGTSHAVLKERTRLVATETIRFLRAEFPAPTFAPIRRATPPSP